MSIKVLKAMTSRPSSKGWFQQFGKSHTGRRQRHLTAQMKFFSGPKYKNSSRSALSRIFFPK